METFSGKMIVNLIVLALLTTVWTLLDRDPSDSTPSVSGEVAAAAVNDTLQNVSEETRRDADGVYQIPAHVTPEPDVTIMYFLSETDTVLCVEASHADYPYSQRWDRTTGEIAAGQCDM